MYTADKMFALRIKELRKSRGLTQQQMADMVQLRKTTISNYESGYSTPSIPTLRKFVECFNLPPSYFLPDMENELTAKKAQILYGTPIPYYLPTNIKGLSTLEPCCMDSSLSLPSPMNLPKSGYISTSAADNSMNKCGIKKGSILIINTDRKELFDGEIFAALKNDALIIRKYHNNIEGRYMSAESTRIPTGLSIEEIPRENFKVLGIIDKIVTSL